VPKDDPRIECYGTVDELNAHIGLAAVLAGERPETAGLVAELLRVGHELFNLGAILATTPERVGPRQARITDSDVAALERSMDRIEALLPPLPSFVLPGGTHLCAELHVARTVCRRAERLLVAAARQAPVDPVNLRYLNRLSDALFVWSRWACSAVGAPEVLWSPNQSATARED
jgi:cob(I)alamin adenosyltransferase